MSRVYGAFGWVKNIESTLAEADSSSRPGGVSIVAMHFRDPNLFTVLCSMCPLTGIQVPDGVPAAPFKSLRSTVQEPTFSPEFGQGETILWMLAERQGSKHDCRVK